MKAAIEGHENSTKRPIPSLFDKQIDIKSNEKGRERDKGDKRDRIDKEKKDRAKQRDSEKREDDEKEKKSRPPVEPLVRDRTVRRVSFFLKKIYIYSYAKIPAYFLIFFKFHDRLQCPLENGI